MPFGLFHVNGSRAYINQFQDQTHVFSVTGHQNPGRITNYEQFCITAKKNTLYIQLNASHNSTQGPRVVY